jgi:hypothetical protein
MALKSKNDHISSINIRIHPSLKTSLDLYCEEHIEKIAEAVTSAIKEYIGFGKPPVERPVHIHENIEGKALRLDIRVHSRLKEALQDYCDKKSELITDTVTDAIKMYIRFEK